MMFRNHRTKEADKPAVSLADEASNDAAPLPKIVARSGVPKSALSESFERLREDAQATAGLRDRLRAEFRERLRPENSGISLTDLDEGAQTARDAVRQIAVGVVDDAQRRGLSGQAAVITDAQAEELVGYLLACQFGAGALDYLFHEGDIEDICINSERDARGELRMRVFTKRQSGKREEPVVVSPEEVFDLVNREAARQGRALNAASPILNAQMRNGSRLAATINPVCDPYVAVTIRLHRLVARSFDDLTANGTMTVAAASYVWMCVQAGLSMVIGGGTASGKTNLLNAIARIMPRYLRVGCIEDTRELDLAVDDKFYLVTAQNAQGERAISQRQLVQFCLRQSPDRIVLGEVRDAAAWDAIKASNTGHQGTLLTVHAEDAAGVLTRLIQLSSEAPETANIPPHMMREIIASAFQYVVFMKRYRAPDGRTVRRCTQIVELNGHVTDGAINQQEMFAMSAGGLVWTGAQPHEKVRDRFLDAGFTELDIADALGGRRAMWREHA